MNKEEKNPACADIIKIRKSNTFFDAGSFLKLATAAAKIIKLHNGSKHK